MKNWQLNRKDKNKRNKKGEQSLDKFTNNLEEKTKDNLKSLSLGKFNTNEKKIQLEYFCKILQDSKKKKFSTRKNLNTDPYKKLNRIFSNKNLNSNQTSNFLINKKFSQTFSKISGLSQFSQNSHHNQILEIPYKKLKLAIHKTLYKKYSNTNKIYKNFMIENLIFSRNCRIISKFKDFMIYDHIDEFLKRFYKFDECRERIPKFVNYYKNYLKFFCNPQFRDFKINSLIQDYGDNKAEIYYNQNYKEKKKKKNEENYKEIFDTTIKQKISEISFEKNFTNKEDKMIISNLSNYEIRKEETLMLKFNFDDYEENYLNLIKNNKINFSFKNGESILNIFKDLNEENQIKDEQQIFREFEKKINKQEKIKTGNIFKNLKFSKNEENYSNYKKFSETSKINNFIKISNHLPIKNPNFKPNLQYSIFNKNQNEKIKLSSTHLKSPKENLNKLNSENVVSDIPRSNHISEKVLNEEMEIKANIIDKRDYPKVKFTNPNKDHPHLFENFQSLHELKNVNTFVSINTQNHPNKKKEKKNLSKNQVTPNSGNSYNPFSEQNTLKPETHSLKYTVDSHSSSYKNKIQLNSDSFKNKSRSLNKNINQNFSKNLDDKVYHHKESSKTNTVIHKINTFKSNNDHNEYDEIMKIAMSLFKENSSRNKEKESISQLSNLKISQNGKNFNSVRNFSIANRPFTNNKVTNLNNFNININNHININPINKITDTNLILNLNTDEEINSNNFFLNQINSQTHSENVLNLIKTHENFTRNKNSLNSELSENKTKNSKTRNSFDKNYKIINNKKKTHVNPSLKSSDLNYLHDLNFNKNSNSIRKFSKTNSNQFKTNSTLVDLFEINKKTSRNKNTTHSLYQTQSGNTNDFFTMDKNVNTTENFYKKKSFLSPKQVKREISSNNNDKLKSCNLNNLDDNAKKSKIQTINTSNFNY